MLKKTLLALATVALCANAGVALADAAVVKVGATPTAVPFNFLDPKTNTLQGVMIDLAEALGKEVGFKPEIMAIPFASLVPSLQTDRIQLISSAFAVTEKRAETVDFTQVVVTYGEALVVSEKDSADYKNLNDLADKVIGVQIGTAYVEPVKAVSGIKEVKMYESMADMVRDVALGRLDGAIGDGPTIAYQVRTQGVKGVRYVESYEAVVPTRIALAVKKGDAERLATLNEGIDALRADGTIDAILKKWKIAS